MLVVVLVAFVCLFSLVFVGGEGYKSFKYLSVNRSIFLQSLKDGM